MTFIAMIASGSVWLLKPSWIFANNFSASQREVIRWAYSKGKPHGFPETMRAIAWQESSFGVNLRNDTEGSLGIFGNRAVIVATRLFRTWRHTPTQAEIESVSERLITDREFAADCCIAELRFWQDRRKNWDQVIMSYNAGHKMQNGEKYLKEIREKMAILKTA